MDGVRFDLVRLAAPFALEVHAPDASLFYYVTRGSAWLELPPDVDAPTLLAEGTALATDRGRRHVWRDRRSRGPVLAAEELPTVPFGTPPEPGTVDIVMGRIPRRASALVGGSEAFAMIPAGTPPYDALFAGIAAILEAELSTPQVDREAVERRLAEIILIQLVRFGLDTMSPETGRLPVAAMQDDRILKALTAFHQEPARPWTVAAFAEIAGLSRTAFAARFQSLMGEAPMHYAARLRMRLAAAALRAGRRSLLDVAQAVGYRSEAAFIRAFQRQFGEPPGRWRRAGAAAGEPTGKRV